MDLQEGPTGEDMGDELVEMKRSESTEVANLTLHQYARYGDESELKEFLRKHGSAVEKQINQRDKKNLTPLHYAARYSSLGVVKLLVDNGSEVNKSGEHNITALHLATKNRLEKNKRRETTAEDSEKEENETEFGQAQESVIEYLISKGADVNAVDMCQKTPLHFAARRGNEVACRELLKVKNIKIEAQDKQGITPLHVAAIHNQVEVAIMLIDAGANLRCTDHKQSTPLHHASAEGNVKLMQALFDAGAKTPEASKMVNDQDVERSTCLHRAIDNGNYDGVKLCLEKGADVNQPCRYHMYPLHLAAILSNVNIVKLLVENSARIDAVENEQHTALHFAAAFNKKEVVSFLVDRGAHIDRRDTDNDTPLLLAAMYGCEDIVELLLEKGAHYSAMNIHDKTAIYLAAEHNKHGVLEKLLSNDQVKCLIDLSDQHDASPLHIACQKGYLDIVKVLIEHDAHLTCKNDEEQTPIHLAAKSGHTKVVREIVNRDKSVLNIEDEHSNTALHLAAEFGHKKVVEILLKLGADVFARNYNKLTPLDLAASKGWTKTCSVLLDDGAPVDPIDDNKTTPLHLASQNGHALVVEMLLGRGADVTIKNSEGKNCLDLAIESNHSNVAMMIINSDVWQQALCNSIVDSASDRVDTPMRKLIKRMPDVAKHCFDRCLSYGEEKNPEHPDYEITFHYEFLDDTYMPWMKNYRKGTRGADTSSVSKTSCEEDAFDDDGRLRPGAKPYTSDSSFIKNNHPLIIMVTSEQEGLLRHPLVTSLLYRKWTLFARAFYYFSFFIYFLFLSFLTGYIMQADPPQSFVAEDRDLIEDNSCAALSKEYSQEIFSTIAVYLIIGLAAVNLFKELLQMYQARLAYLGWINLIEWITYVTAVLLVISFNECQQKTGYRYEWQWSLGTVSIFLGWMNLVLFIQKFPQLGIFVVMFTDILYTFLKFFIVFFLFITAFALAFYAVLQQQQPFSNVPKALIKTSVMMIGEFDFDTIFHDNVNKVNYSAVSYILFVAFLIIMSILLMNLLVGLAVDDIKAVQEQAALQRMAMQVEHALDVERVLPEFIRRKACAKHDTFKPNRISNLFKRYFYTQAGMTAKSLHQHLNPKLGDIEKVQESQKKICKEINKLKQKAKSLQRVEFILEELIHILKSEWEDEDYEEEDEMD